ncbi:glucans biosynthesis glucosyltransferase MdoH [Xanthomonas sontii]|uniref:Glucans biosynthesis glucosyltransferase H n=2 Tax=Xanthomonas sontii TaxID=2650745 RepID=A0A6N7Q8J4_9XANT|nr:glucans biosynthesis glucosyltransferase MdoH [Xanthomonas sontii]MRH73602.1 glucans biosynthesis glucosyltransferase MdoH [Xanthomonas sontii]
MALRRRTRSADRMSTVAPTPAVHVDAPLDAGHAVLPPEAPLAMPLQSLQEGKLRNTRLPSTPVGIGWRRFYVFGTTAAMTAYASWLIGKVLVIGGVSVLEACLMVLFIPLFAWIALSFVSALAGFFTLVFGKGRKLGIDPDAPLPQVRNRTALLMPTYNEDPHRLMAGLQAIYESVAATGQIERFDFFILSDTTRPAIGVEEEKVYAELVERVGGQGRLFYRRRASNAGRKAGNIADWVRRFGGAYPQMLILDADSLMTGDSIVRLAAGMEANPDVGLIQTLPEVVNGNTLFARMQQFGGRVYGPVIAFGVAWWHGAESNYWGHNAMIRTEAFAAQAGLPSLPGRKPFCGHVLSHDFVEAALMRRGGWAMHMVPYLQGSYEEGPPTLTDLLVRDRRWCQGNLQHSKVVRARGLHWVSRMHMLIGIGHYFTAPMWGMLMLIGIAIPLQNGGFDLVASVISPFSPARYWHQQDSTRVAWVFAVTMFVLLAPKVMGYFAMLLKPGERRGCGGGLRAFASMLLETLLAALMAPVVMYVQSRGVAEVLAGKDSGWDAQQRDDGRISWSALLRSYGGLSAFGLLMGGMAYAVSPSLAAWMAPVVIGMALAVPVVAISSSRAAGLWLRKLRILAIPEESQPPAVLLRAAELRREAAARRAEAEAQAAG